MTGRSEVSSIQGTRERDQIWVGYADQTPSSDRVQKLSNDPAWGRKPRGGIWTVALSEGDGAWQTFFQAENLRGDEPMARFLLTPFPGVRVLHLDTPAQAQAAWESYPGATFV